MAVGEVPLAAGEVPPSCNTGAESAKPGDAGPVGEDAPSSPLPAAGRSALVDYLRITFFDLAVEEVLALFGREGLEWTGQEFGGRFYRRSYRRGHVKVFWDGHGQAEGTVHVEASGKGCRELETEGVVADWCVFLGWALRAGGRLTRLDLAVDDREGLLTPGRVSECFRSDQLATRAKGRSVREIADRDGGYTLYVGSRQSDTSVRIYDKNAEQGVTGDLGPVLPWVRCELELHDQRAQRMAELLAAAPDRCGELVCGAMRSHLRFTEGDQVKKVQRADAWWWSAFLAGAAKVKLGTAPAARTLERAVRWVARQVLPTLGMLSLANEVGIKGLWELISEGRRRMKDEHIETLLVANRERRRHDWEKGEEFWWGKIAGLGRPVPRYRAAVAYHLKGA